MPIPATSGQFRTNLQDMQIGDYIAFKTLAGIGNIPTISEIGATLETAQANEIPIAGTNAPNGYAYAIKVDKGLCIADRVVQHSVSWDILNTGKLINGYAPLSYPFSPLAFVASYPITNICDKNSTTQALIDGVTRGNYAAYTADQRSVTFYLGKQVDSFELTIKTNYGMDTFEVLTSLDGTNWTSAGAKNIALNTQQTYTITATCKFFKIYDIRTSYDSANLGISEVSVAGIESLLYKKYMIRSLTGGNSYLGADGKLSLTDQNLGAFPTNNEWDRYIVNSNLGGRIIAGDDNVWHWAPGQSTLCQDTPVNNLTATNDTGSSGMRIQRGRYIYNGTTYGPNINSIDVTTKAIGYDGIGFRPVFQFLELNSKASSLFY